MKLETSNSRTAKTSSPARHRKAYSIAVLLDRRRSAYANERQAARTGQIDLIKRWIEEGADWPEMQAMMGKLRGIGLLLHQFVRQLPMLQTRLDEKSD